MGTEAIWLYRFTVYSGVTVFFALWTTNVSYYSTIHFHCLQCSTNVRHDRCDAGKTVYKNYYWKVKWEVWEMEQDNHYKI